MARNTTKLQYEQKMGNLLSKYWGASQTINELMSKIVDHFEAKKDHLKRNLDCNETDLLKKLRFEKCCGLQKDTPNESGLFGYGSLKADYRPNGDSDIIIEVKYIRNRAGKWGLPLTLDIFA